MSDEATPTIDRIRKRMDEYAETYGVRGDFAVSVLRSEFEAALVEIVATKLVVEETAWALYEGSGSREDFARLSASYAPGSPIGKAFMRAAKVHEAILGSD